MSTLKGGLLLCQWEVCVDFSLFHTGLQRDCIVVAQRDPYNTERFSSVETLLYVSKHGHVW